MPRKKQKPQTSYAVSFQALRAAMADLKTDDPTYFDLTCLHQKFLDEVAPAMLAGFADAQIIAALEKKAAGSAEAMTALVRAVRKIVESARNGEGGDVAKVPNMESPCQSSAVAGPERIHGRMVKRRPAPKSPSTALPPPQSPAGEAISEPSTSGMKTPAAEVVAPEATNGVEAAPAATPPSSSTSAMNSEAPMDQAKPTPPPLPDAQVAMDKPLRSAEDSATTAEAKIPKPAKTTKPLEQTSFEYSGDS